MAPMDPAKPEVDESFSRESLEKELSTRSDNELQEMGGRLSKSHNDLTDMLDELQVEQQLLQEENQSLHETITLMMSELQKLHIGADNTVEPRLQEGPLDFVGRFWEKVKPRDTAYIVSDHVGEIKKPAPGQERATPQEVGKQVVQQVGQTLQQQGKQLGQKLGPLWQRAEGLLSNAKGEVAERVAAARAKRESGGRRTKAAAASREKGAAVAEEAAEPPAQAAPVEEEPAKPAPATPAASSSPVAAKASSSSAPEKGSEVESTILIEAQLKIDDGSVQTCKVCAADRPKEVAQRFVQEHSLKAWFTEPLTAWLKKVEADADKFPVKVEADLMEIRKQFSKAK